MIENTFMCESAFRWSPTIVFVGPTLRPCRGRPSSPATYPSDQMRHHLLLLLAAILLLPPLSTAAARPLILLLSKADADAPSDAVADDSASEGDDFPDTDLIPDDLLDPGSWRSIVEPESPSNATSSLPSPSHPDPDSISAAESLYVSGIHKMLSAVASSDPRSMDGAAADITAAARVGHPHAQSTLAFLFGTGNAMEHDPAKAFLYHHFAAEGGNMQSKMAVAFTYLRQELYEKSVKLYAELADAALASFQAPGDLPLIEPVRLHSGVEENKDGLRKSRGEEDEDFQIAEYQAHKGNAAAMYKIGVHYYYGLRGVRKNPQKALYWFAKAVDKGEPRALELLGETYARGAGVERDYKKALDCFTRASEQKRLSAYNGLGFLYVKGYGVEKNLTKAHELFEKAAKNGEAAGFYNLGMLYFKGIGVKRNIIIASEYITKAAGAGQPKAIYQLAKMFQAGVGFKKDLKTASHLFKVVAERGPWSTFSRWALECYLKGEVGKALLLYSRMAEMGYEVAQSNAAWILDKYGERSMCMGELGLCTDAERDQRSHSLWWQASEQGNEHAALLIGDAYYYGRGTERDYERAAEAYVHAQLQSNAQAMFNLGYMHEHGQGLPRDLHLAKRYYDQALETDPAAKLPVSLALTSLWIRKNYENSFVVDVLDSLPEVYPKVKSWIDEVILDEGNVTILTLFICLLTVLYLRDRQRRQVVQPPHQPNAVAAN